jgi:hypothetical protein
MAVASLFKTALMNLCLVVGSSAILLIVMLTKLPTLDFV